MTTIQNNLIKEFGMEGLDQEQQKEILTKMTELLLKEISIKVLEKLSEEDRETFLGMQGESSPEEIESFLTTKIENYEDLVEKTTRDFREEIKTLIDLGK